MKEILLTEKRDGIPCVIIFPCSYTIHFTGDISTGFIVQQTTYIIRSIQNHTQWTYRIHIISVDIQNTYNITEGIFITPKVINKWK